MIDLKWDSTDFLDCLEVFPEFYEDSYSYTYEVIQNELVLTLTVSELDSHVSFSIRQRSDRKPVLTYTVFVRDGVLLLNEGKGSHREFRGCFIAPPEALWSEFEPEKFRNKPGFIIWLEVKPQIQILFV